MRISRRTFAILLLPGGLSWADLQSVKAEKNLYRRARKAMENANAALDAAREAYLAGDLEQTNTRLQEVEDSVRLAYDSLQATGRKPRKIAKHYKRAEIGARQLIRRLNGFRDSMSYVDRDKIDKVIDNVEQLQDMLLNAVMGGGR